MTDRRNAPRPDYSQIDERYRRGLLGFLGQDPGQAAGGYAIGTPAGLLDLGGMGVNAFSRGMTGEPVFERPAGDAFRESVGVDPESGQAIFGEMASPGGLLAGAVKLLGKGVMAATPLIMKGGGTLEELIDAQRKSDNLSGEFELQDFPPIDVSVPDSAAHKLEMSRRIGTTGQYRGAPRGVTNPSRLGRLRQNLEESLVRGVVGRNWYDRSSEKARYLTGDRPNLRDRYALMIAHTSTGAAVPTNQGFAIKGHNQAVVGDPIHTGRFPNTQAIRIEQGLSGEPTELPSKVGPFYEANTLDPDSAKILRPTNDLWMARAFGYKRVDPKTGKLVEWSEGLNPAQHRFMDEELLLLTERANEKKLGGFDDWTPERVQAAIWVDTKARFEKTSVEKAAMDFADAMDANTINITSESVPSKELEHLEGFLGNPENAEEYTRLQNRVMQNEKGQSLVALSTGALTRSSKPGTGYYFGDTNPATATQILGGRLVREKGATPIVDESSEKLARGIAAAEGLLKGQATVGLNFLRKAGNAAQRNSARVDLPPTPENFAKLEAALEAEFGPGKFALSHQGDRAINILPTSELPMNTFSVEDKIVRDLPDLPDADAWQKPLIRAMNKATGEKHSVKDLMNNVMVRGDTTGDTPIPGLVGDVEAYKPSALIRDIDAAGPEVAERMDPLLRLNARELETIDRVIATKYPDAGQRSEVLSLTRRILSESGLAGIRDAVQKGILPAIVLAALGLQEAPRSETGSPLSGGLLGEI